MPGALEGIRVVDWTLWQVGPVAAAMLGDLGADVIHVEERGRGDTLREIMVPASSLPHNRHMHFEEHNRNKRGIAVDLKKPQGREVVYRLVQQADVFVTNFRSRAARKLGMDYQTLRQHNPRLIYAHATGFGTRGPDKDDPCAETVAQARSGAMMGSGEPGAPPTTLTIGIGDRITGIHLAYGIVVALLARERYGFGQEVHTSQLGSMLALQGFSITPVLLKGAEHPKHSRSRPQSALSNEYRCKDGKWIMFLIGRQSDQHWGSFCQVIGMPRLRDDPRFSDEAKRAEHVPELVAILDEVFATRDATEWYALLKGVGDIMVSPVNTFSDLLHDPQVVENKYITGWDHPVLGNIKFVGFPLEFSETPPSLRLPAPDLGQHTQEVLLETGYSQEEIEALRQQEVI